jgi:hypothetical protein
MADYVPIDTQIFDIGRTSGTPPGAGNNYTFTVPANARYHILNARYTLSTDANVADRYHVINVSIDGNTHTIGLFDQAQTASLAWQVSWHSGLSQHVDLTANNLAALSMGQGVILGAGDSLSAQILGLQVGDQITNITLTWRRWIIA